MVARIGFTLAILAVLAILAFLLHTCGHKWCVNPDHIVKGTVSSVARARKPKKLSDSDVQIIRSLIEEEEATQTAIAEMFGVTPAQISNIKYGRSRAMVR